VAAEYALDLPALAVEPLEEAPLHLAAVFLAGPLARLGAALGRDDALGPQFLAHQHVHPLGVVACIEQGRAEGDPPVGLPENFFGLAGVSFWTHRDFGRENKVGGDVAGGRELGPALHLVALASAPGVVARDVAGFEARSVPGDPGVLLDKAGIPGPCNCFGKEGIEAPFSSSLSSAQQRVE